MDWESLTDKFSAAGERFGKGMLRVFGSQNERAVKRMEPVIDVTNNQRRNRRPTRKRMHQDHRVHAPATAKDHGFNRVRSEVRQELV